jgi:hypothetical protein
MGKEYNKAVAACGRRCPAVEVVALNAFCRHRDTGEPLSFWGMRGAVDVLGWDALHFYGLPHLPGPLKYRFLSKPRRLVDIRRLQAEEEREYIERLREAQA